MENEEVIHFIFENKEVIFTKYNNKFDIQQYSSQIKNILPYIFNTNNYSLMSKCIHLIDYKTLNTLKKKDKKKINRFIQESNKINQIFFQRKICNDVIKHTINTILCPVDIDYVSVNEVKNMLLDVNKNVESFLENYNEKNKNDLLRIYKLILTNVEQVDEIIHHKKYKDIKRKLKVNIVKNFYKLFITDLAKEIFNNNYFLQVAKEKAVKHKKESDDEEFHDLINAFLEKY